MPFLLLLLSVSAQAAIFGTDNRLPAPPSGFYGEIAKSTAIAVLSGNYEPADSGKLRLSLNKLSESFCSEEKFSSDLSLSYACTGFLVAPDLIATAGHCMVNVGESKNEKASYCEVFSWLFDFRGNAEVEASQLYRCKEIVYAVREESSPFRDYALVRLDRPVTDRKPLKIAASAPSKYESFTMVGYPFGSSAKVSLGGKALVNDPQRGSFLTNLDAFEGNSGSPVLNQAREVVGILVGGTPSQSLVQDASRGCQRYNHCDENGRNCTVPDSDTSVFPGYQGVGSEVQRIAPLRELIESLH